MLGSGKASHPERSLISWKMMVESARLIKSTSNFPQRQVCDGWRHGGSVGIHEAGSIPFRWECLGKIGGCAITQALRVVRFPWQI